MSHTDFTYPLTMVEGRALTVQVQAGSMSDLLDVLATYIPETAHAMIWTNYSVLAGQKEGNTVQLSNGKALSDIAWPQLVRIQVFTDHSELLLVRDGNTMVGRFIDDASQEGQAISYVDSSSRILGQSQQDQTGPFVHLFEEGRKLNLTIPTSQISKNGHYILVTRNYVAPIEATGQVGYVDSRILSIQAEEV